MSAICSEHETTTDFDELDKRLRSFDKKPEVIDTRNRAQARYQTWLRLQEKKNERHS